jgi:hypothetical protein
LAKRSSKNSREPALLDAPDAAATLAEPEAWTAARLSEQLGVAVDEVEQLQASICVAGEDFVDAAGVAVLTATGLKKIRARVQEDQLAAVPMPAPLAELPSGRGIEVDYGAPVPPTHREDLRLTRVFRWSTNVLAETAAGLEVVVRVRAIAHLEAGMVLPACIRGEMGWTYEGRLPRTIGERQLYFPPHPAASNQRKK